jgi:hypothetical protein
VSGGPLLLFDQGEDKTRPGRCPSHSNTSAHSCSWYGLSSAEILHAPATVILLWLKDTQQGVYIFTLNVQGAGLFG